MQGSRPGVMGVAGQVLVGEERLRADVVEGP